MDDLERRIPLEQRSLFRQARRAGNLHLAAQVLLDSAMQATDADSVVPLATRALTIAEEQGDLRNQLTANHILYWHYNGRKAIAQQLHHLQEMKRLSIASGDHVQIEHMLEMVGTETERLDLKEEYIAAEQELIAFYDQRGDSRGVLRVLNQMAYYYTQHKHDNTEVLAFAGQALRLLQACRKRETQGSTQDTPSNYAQHYEQIGDIFRRYDAAEQALDMYREASVILRAARLHATASHDQILYRIHQCYLMLDDYRQAIQAIAMIRQYPSTVDYSTIIEAALGMGAPQLAVVMLERMAENPGFRRNHHIETQAALYFDLARLLHEHLNTAWMAREYAFRCVALSDRFNSENFATYQAYLDQLNALLSK